MRLSVDSFRVASNAELVGEGCRSVWFGNDVYDEPELKHLNSGLVPPVTLAEARGPGPHSPRNHIDPDHGTGPLLKRFCSSGRTSVGDLDCLGADSCSGTKAQSQRDHHSCVQHTRTVPISDELMSACNNFGVLVKHDYQQDFACISLISGAGSCVVDDVRNYDMSCNHFCSVDETSCVVGPLVDPQFAIVSPSCSTSSSSPVFRFQMLFFHLCAILAHLLPVITKFPNGRLRRVLIWWCVRRGRWLWHAWRCGLPCGWRHAKIWRRISPWGRR